MAVGGLLLAGLAGLAGPLALGLSYARQARRDSDAITQRLVREAGGVRFPEAKPGRWPNHVAAIMLLAMPIVQYVGYAVYRSSLVVFVPLALTMVVVLAVGLWAPVIVPSKAPDRRRWAFFFALLAAATANSFLMSATGSVLIMRGVLIDVAGLMVATFVVNTALVRKNASTTASL